MRARGDVDYERHGTGYSTQRRADPRIAAVIHAPLAGSRTVLNVGAGAGSYEPTDRRVVAVEPSRVMRAQRPPGSAPAIGAVAEALPFGDGAFDASMAILTLHQWADWRRGLGELRRVTRGPITVVTFDGDALDRFWLAAYAPELIAVERRRSPAIGEIRACLGPESEERTIPIPIDCVDGFAEAYYARPERFLDPAVRRAQSAWTFLEPGAEAAFVAHLREDLASGAWDLRFGDWRRRSHFEGSLRLIISGQA